MKHATTIRLLLFLAGIAIQTSARAEDRAPPVPEWQPEFSITNEEVLERMIYYFDDNVDVAIFRHGTAVIIPDGLNDDDAKEFALNTLSKIYNFHADMNPLHMDDGNILISYNHPAYNIVKDDFAITHIDTIRARYLDALATDEVLIGPMGANKFDEFSMKALYGRTFMFMDAQNPTVIEIYRH